jgi:hypothetical protein
MTGKLRWVWIAPGFLAALTLSCGTAAAADKSKVDQATKRVERGAKQIGRGQVGPGFTRSRALSEGPGCSLTPADPARKAGPSDLAERGAG